MIGNRDPVCTIPLKLKISTKRGESEDLGATGGMMGNAHGTAMGRIDHFDAKTLTYNISVRRQL